MTQVNSDVSPQYATVTQASVGRNNGTVYLATDYITYCDYYPAVPSTGTVTSDQYQTVRHITSNNDAPSTSPSSVTYTQASDSNETSFLDRYLRQNSTGSATTNGVIYKTTSLPGGLTVDLPSPDSGIGEATITPRPDNGSLPQVLLLPNKNIYKFVQITRIKMRAFMQIHFSGSLLCFS